MYNMPPSPEMIQESPYNAPTDIWAVGVLLYELMARCRPFQATEIQVSQMLRVLARVREMMWVVGGDPLCHDRQAPRILGACFRRFLFEQCVSGQWCLVRGFRQPPPPLLWYPMPALY